MKKTILTILLGVLLIFSMTGCGGKNNSNGILGNKSLKASDLSIEDFKWETVSGKCDGYDCYVLSLTNNSKYDIIGVNFSYKVKDEVTDSQLNVYEEFKGYNRERALSKVSLIYDVVKKIIEISKNEDIPTYLAADRLAENRINKIAKISNIYLKK